MKKYNCICCNKEIECYDDVSDTYDWNMMWIDGSVDQMSINYGSKFDGEILSFGICDDCIEEKKNKEIIKETNR